MLLLFLPRSILLLSKLCEDPKLTNTFQLFSIFCSVLTCVVSGRDKFDALCRNSFVQSWYKLVPRVVLHNMQSLITFEIQWITKNRTGDWTVLELSKRDESPMNVLHNIADMYRLRLELQPHEHHFFSMCNRLPSHIPQIIYECSAIGTLLL